MKLTKCSYLSSPRIVSSQIVSRGGSLHRRKKFSTPANWPTPWVHQMRETFFLLADFLRLLSGRGPGAPLVRTLRATRQAENASASILHWPARSCTANFFGPMASTHFRVVVKNCSASELLAKNRYASYLVPMSSLRSSRASARAHASAARELATRTSFSILTTLKL